MAKRKQFWLTGPTHDPDYEVLTKCIQSRAANYGNTTRPTFWSEFQVLTPQLRHDKLKIP